MRLTATMCILILAVSAQARVLRVDCMGYGDHVLVQGAIYAAESGDTISIAPCVYEERISIPSKSLTFIGESATETILRWSGSDPMVVGQGYGARLAFIDMTLERVPSGSRAIHWNGYKLVFRDCVVIGKVENGFAWPSAGTVDAERSSFTWLNVSTTAGASTMHDCRADYASFSGYCEEPPNIGHQSLTSTASRYGDFRGSHLTADSVADSFGSVYLSASELTANDGSIGPIFTQSGSLNLDNCLIFGDVLADNIYSSGLYGLELSHCTLLGDLTEWEYFSAPCRLRSNIVAGATSLYTYAGSLGSVSHNDFVGGFGSYGVPADSIYANISEDPLFCGEISGDYTLQDCSPCAGAGHDGESMGSLGVGCDCMTPVEATSWGAIKAQFR